MIGRGRFTLRYGLGFNGSVALTHFSGSPIMYFFRLHHPDRERFEREGWLTAQAAAEAK